YYNNKKETIKATLYIMIGVIYLAGLFLLVDFLLNIQNETFKNHYLMLLFPFFSLF
ncbi:preprotein translocase subunit SecE, partial [Peribacillus butanolivorans]|uniref:preprotein translocase subunit SecE n=1 Tax=Peribacillus butanolivorans TaxID=421767 RepID=UPI0036B8E94B